MTSALDEVSTEYGLLAEAVSYPADFASATYRLRANARWHDGKPVTPEDVISRSTPFKENSPAARRLLSACDQWAEKTGEREIDLHFRRAGQPRVAADRRPVARAGEALVEGADKSGKKRDVTRTTLEPPLGSGTYRPEGIRRRTDLGYEKVADYWGKDLNVAYRHAQLPADPLRVLPRLHRCA